MTRKALIIANPGERGKQGYCAGVLKDVESYTTFLMSANGGLWREDEIKVLHQPSRGRTENEVRLLTVADYSLTVFCGHGYHSAASNATIVELSPGTDLDSDELRRGAAKHSLVLDCCRVVATPVTALAEDVRAMAKKAAAVIHPTECRKFYDARIAACPHGLVVLFACSVGESAGDSERDGGYYSYSLMNTARLWARNTQVDTDNEYGWLSVVTTHDVAVPGVRRLSGGRQTPTIEKPRSGEYFPFCIIA